MKSNSYYMLITSLPYLKRFDKIERLPISRERLIQRLKSLEPEDYQIANMTANFIAWRNQPVGRSNSDIADHYNKWVWQIFESPLLAPLFQFSVDQRTIMVALRRRQLGLPSSQAGEPWGVGHLVGHIERHWEDPTFNLAARYPWIQQVSTYLKEGESLKLDHLLMKQVWDRIDRLLFKNNFGLEAVIAYLLKWDLIQQWLSYNVEEAKSRIEENIAEILDEYEHRRAS